MAHLGLQVVVSLINYQSKDTFKEVTAPTICTPTNYSDGGVTSITAAYIY